MMNNNPSDRKCNDKLREYFLDSSVKFATVSGILSTKTSIIEDIDKTLPEIDLVTTKSFQVLPNPGNREPILVEVSPGSFGNAVGLRNPGMEAGYRELKLLLSRRKLRSILNVSLSANSIDDFITLVRRFQGIADILELNFSCPHAKASYGASIGSSAEIVSEYVKAISPVAEKMLFVKLTPNVENIGEIASAAVSSGADGISAINTVGPEMYTEPFTGEPILYNPRGHRGGKSGEWIRETALLKVAEIRKAVGPKIPIIGMGGISTGKDVREMISAGANVIGLGSVFARVLPEHRKLYLADLKADASFGTDRADRFLIRDRQMEYKPYKITGIREITPDLRVFELEGHIDFLSGQFVFLWIPGVGEKPYSVVKNNPLTFLVRRRPFDPDCECGLVSNALFELHKNQFMMIRGVYGRKAPIASSSSVWIAAGGTGMAVVPQLVEELLNAGKIVTLFYGASSEAEMETAGWVNPKVSIRGVPDEGKLGRVLDILENALGASNPEELSVYNIGPETFMKKAAEIETQGGITPDRIFLNLEPNTMCGVGMCGECAVRGRLTCREGSFFTMQFLEEAAEDWASCYI